MASKKQYNHKTAHKIGADIAEELIEQAVKVGQAIGFASVNWFRELIAKRQPPIKKGQGPRQARQGGWADRTSNLANAYASEVKPTPTGAQITLSNSMRYASYLEAKSDYFVVMGIIDPKRSPLDEFMQEYGGMFKQ